jgi:hypothetical protein
MLSCDPLSKLYFQNVFISRSRANIFFFFYNNILPLLLVICVKRFVKKSVIFKLKSPVLTPGFFVVCHIRAHSMRPYIKRELP